MSILPKEDLGLKDLACSRKSYPVESDEYLSYGIYIFIINELINIFCYLNKI